MKKLSALLLSMILVFSLAACSGGNSSSGESTASEASAGASEASEASASLEVSEPSADMIEASGPASEAVETDEASETASGPLEPVEEGGILVAYFSWSGNTRKMAEAIAQETGADLFEITPAEPYTDDYNELLDIAQREQSEGARPELSAQVENWDSYDTIFIGYPNWWASIPMPIASFLEEYDFSGKTILPFCSHGGGLGQSQTAIAKLVPDAVMAEGLAINYSGGSGMPDDVAVWLEQNHINME